MPESWNVSYAAMAVMALVGLFTVVFPLGLGLVFWRKFGGRWRFFLLGCVIFPLFALTLEGSVNRAVLYGPIGDTITGNLWLYALFGGAMAGIFEECGRWAAFRLTRRWSRGPEDALMYGAGHGGIEAALLAGSMMLNNLLDVADVPLEVFASEGTEAHWASQAAANLAASGVLREEETNSAALGGTLTRADAAELLDGALDVLAAREDDGWFPW